MHKKLVYVCCPIDTNLIMTIYGYQYFKQNFTYLFFKFYLFPWKIHCQRKKGIQGYKKGKERVRAEIDLAICWFTLQVPSIGLGHPSHELDPLYFQLFCHSQTFSENVEDIGKHFNCF